MVISCLFKILVLSKNIIQVFKVNKNIKNTTTIKQINTFQINVKNFKLNHTVNVHKNISSIMIEEICVCVLRLAVLNRKKDV